MRSIPLRLWALVFVSAGLQVLSFPIAGPAPVWRSALCWIALAPLIKALISDDESGRPLTVRHGTVLGYFCGFLWYLGNCYWIYPTMHIYGGISQPASVGILILFCLYLGLYHAAFGAAIAGLRRSGLSTGAILLLTPFIWVAVELARSRITGFPWDLLGIAQVDNPLLTRIAPVAGAYGISFVIAGVNAIWLTQITMRERRHTRTILTGAGFVVVLLYIVFLRYLQHPVSSGTPGTATLLQENLSVGAESSAPERSKAELLQDFSALSLFPPQDQVCHGIPELSSTKCGSQNHDKSHTERYLTRSGLIVWPEAPNGFFEGDPQFRLAISRLARVAGAPMIVGDIATVPDQSVRRGYDLYNSAEFIQPDGTFAGRYDKMHLVPFGEYVPFKNLLFFAGNLVSNVGDFDPGTRRTLFSTGGHTYGTFICYESVFGDEIRQYQKLGANVLVNISDDGWYGNTSAAWEHLNMVRMRAIENHRWILRSTNTGVTAAIDPYGRVVAAAPRHLRTSLFVHFRYEDDMTFYAEHGDVFAWICVLVTAAALGWSFKSGVRSGEGAAKNLSRTSA